MYLLANHPEDIIREALDCGLMFASSTDACRAVVIRATQGQGEEEKF